MKTCHLAIGPRFKALYPYLIMSAVLPGGIVIALALWLHRRRAAQVAA